MLLTHLQAVPEWEHKVRNKGQNAEGLFDMADESSADLTEEVKMP